MILAILSQPGWCPALSQAAAGFIQPWKAVCPPWGCDIRLDYIEPMKPTQASRWCFKPCNFDLVQRVLPVPSAKSPPLNSFDTLGSFSISPILYLLLPFHELQTQVRPASCDSTTSTLCVLLCWIISVSREATRLEPMKNSSDGDSPQEIALRPLPTSSTHPTPSHAEKPRQNISPTFAPTRLAFYDSTLRSSSLSSHGSSRDQIKVDESTEQSSFRPPDPIVATMTRSEPSLIQDSDVPISYGAVSNFDNTSARTSLSSGDRPRSTSKGWKSRRKSSAVNGAHVATSITKKSSGVSQDEVGGSSIVGGPEGRFGVVEAGLPTDILHAAKSFENSSGGCEDSCITVDEDEDELSGSLDFDPPDNSPYSQVRASVPPTDNYRLSINTPRMWILSTLFSILGSSTNLFFSLRYPSVAITPVIALLLVHPMGLVWDYLLKRPNDPTEEFIDGVRCSNPTVLNTVESSGSSRSSILHKGKLERLRLWLAQGSWNEKEHTCVYVSSNVSFGFAFATDVIVEQTQFYKQEASILYQLLLTLSTQILGYAFAGLTRRFLVRPSGMIWPGTLMSAAMFSTLHKEENKPANGWTMTRWRFFFIIWTCACFFYFLPGLLFPALSYFNVITWFAPKNVVVANLFGVVSGLGLFPMTFDWAQIAYIGSPLLTPFWAAMNVVGGLVIVMWIIAPIAYYLNVYYSSYMPILSSSVFDNTGKIYDVSKILTKDFVLDREAYHNYSRVFLPITYVLSYGLQFAGLASLITHTICWHGKDIWTQWRASLEEAKDEPKPDYEPLSTALGRNGARGTPVFSSSGSNLSTLMGREDVHNRLMRRYKDAPITWYLLTFVVMTAIGIFVVE